MKNTKFIVSETEANTRLDIFLSNKYPDYSRNYFLNLIKNNYIRIDDKIVKPSHKIKSGEEIEIIFVEKEILSDPLAENIPLDIVYEDKNVIVVNKQPGIVVHPSAGHASNTLVNALINHLPEIKKAIYDKESLVSRIRPGIVHRLDKDTSGIIIVAKNAKTMHALSDQIQNRSVKKRYLGLCYGWPKNDEGELIDFLGRDPKNRKLIANIGENRGKKAILRYKVKECYLDKYQNKISLISFDLKTGRTHQIRVQTKRIGTPILGDTLYGNKESQAVSLKNNIQRQLLHACELTINLPDSNKPTTFLAPLPKDFRDAMDELTTVGSQEGR